MFVGFNGSMMLFHIPTHQKYQTLDSFSELLSHPCILGMGVKDLWQLLSPVGRRLSLESLEGKTLAIDARFSAAFYWKYIPVKEKLFI